MKPLWKILGYIGRAVLLLFCVALFWNYLSYNGSAGEKLFLLIGTVILIFIFTADFHDDIIDWFKRHFKD